MVGKSFNYKMHPDGLKQPFLNFLFSRRAIFSLFFFLEIKTKIKSSFLPWMLQKHVSFELNKNVILKTFDANIWVLFRETQIWFDYKQREIFSETFFRIIYFENINTFSAGVLWKITNKNLQENNFKRLYIENKVLQNNIFFARSTHVDTQEGALPPTTLKKNVTLDSWGIISEFINGNMNYYKWQSQIVKKHLFV